MTTDYINLKGERCLFSMKTVCILINNKGEALNSNNGSDPLHVSSAMQDFLTSLSSGSLICKIRMRISN